jgi:hypothetical protein
MAQRPARLGGRYVRPIVRGDHFVNDFDRIVAHHPGSNREGLRPVDAERTRRCTESVFHLRMRAEERVAFDALERDLARQRAARTLGM